MWLLDYVTKNSFSKSKPSVGDITKSSKGTVAVNSELEHRDLPLVVPYGIAYNPPLMEKSVVLELSDRKACLGVLSKGVDLLPGELMLFSKGGASIVLKNNGDVIINGKVFSK